MSLIDRLQRIIERPIQQKFNSAVPNHRGDNLLLTLLGKTLSQPAFASRAYGEGEVFLIKGALFFSGVRLDPSAYEGLGTVWKEEIGQRHYNPNADYRQHNLLPYALNLPHDLYMPLYIDPESPFLLRREAKTLYLYLGEFRLFPVEFEKRPEYYSKSTTTGISMPLIGSHRLQRQLLVEYSTYCQFFSHKEACLFCGIVGERPSFAGRYGKHFAASPAEIAEVVEAAYTEGVCTELQITGGVLPGRAEVPYVLEVGHAIKERLGVAVVPGSQAVIMPPPNLEQIDQLKEAGWQGVAFNLEVWDERLWPGYVPGKSSIISHDRWLEALEYAVQVFGKGQVASILVAGLEPRKSYLSGIEWLAQHSIYGVPIPWTPVPGSALEGHQTPTAAWHLETVVKVLDIWERYGLDAQRHTSGGLHYADLARMRQHLEHEKKKDPNLRLDRDLRYQLAIEGKLPQF